MLKQLPEAKKSFGKDNFGLTNMRFSTVGAPASEEVTKQNVKNLGSLRGKFIKI